MLTYLRWSAQINVKVKTAPQQTSLRSVHYGSTTTYEPDFTGEGQQPPAEPKYMRTPQHLAPTHTRR